MSIHEMHWEQRLATATALLQNVVNVIQAGPDVGISDPIAQWDDWLRRVSIPMFHAASVGYGEMFHALADTEGGAFGAICDLTSAGREVVLNWENGDLAGAVGDMENSLRCDFGYTDEDFEDEDK